MTTLPITQLTLYKHGVGFFQRRNQVTGEEITLSFHVKEINDILKSLTVIDYAGGQVLGIDYATPRTRHEQLAGCSIRLAEERSLRDLIAGIRGRSVTLHLKERSAVSGTLVGLDESDETHPIENQFVTIMTDNDDAILAFQLSEVAGLTLRDEKAAEDLNFFLRSSLSQEDFRQITIRLTPGEHDLYVSYIAPAPAWRVSYRLVGEREGEQQGEGLLLGWGIFDNLLEETLNEIDLSLIAGMPISFTYNLYKPHTPTRPHVEDENRTAAAPVAFDAMMSAEEMHAPDSESSGTLAMMSAAPAPQEMRARRAKAVPSPAAVRQSTSTTAIGEGSSLGELFQYNIATPVTVGRGQSAMVPILSSTLEYNKELLYNRSKFPDHPVATLKLTNTSGVTLERGPVTVIENGEYMGEAMLPFTAENGELLIPYAVELATTIRENHGQNRQTYRLVIDGNYLRTEEWEIFWRDYHIHNQSDRPMTISIEHNRPISHELFDTASPSESSDQSWRFPVPAAAKSQTKFSVKSRRMLYKREAILKLSYSQIQAYLAGGLVEETTKKRLEQLQTLLEPIEVTQERLRQITRERETIHTQQSQIQSNMKSLRSDGKEGRLRSRFVDELEQFADQLATLLEEESKLRGTLESLRRQVEQMIKSAS